MRKLCLSLVNWDNYKTSEAALQKACEDVEAVLSAMETLTKETPGGNPNETPNERQTVRLEQLITQLTRCTRILTRCTTQFCEMMHELNMETKGERPELFISPDILMQIDYKKSDWPEEK